MYIVLCFISRKFMINWMIIYDFKSRSKIFHSYRDVTIAGEGLWNLDLCSALRAFEQWGIFIVPHLLWQGTSVFPVSSKGPPNLVASYDTLGDVEDLFEPGSSRGAKKLWKFPNFQQFVWPWTLILNSFSMSKVKMMFQLVWCLYNL
jgi:hypothetical protein